MSEIVEYLIGSVQEYLRRDIDIDKFREAFVGAYFYIRNNPQSDAEAQSIANSLMLPVAEFAGGHRSEDSLRQELANSIRPFAQNKSSLVIGDRIDLKKAPESSFQLSSGSGSQRVDETELRLA